MSRAAELQQLRDECRALVRRRALVSAGAAVVPVPFFDVVVDAGVLPDAVVVVPELPRAGRGRKLDRAALAASLARFADATSAGKATP